MGLGAMLSTGRAREMGKESRCELYLSGRKKRVKWKPRRRQMRGRKPESPRYSMVNRRTEAEGRGRHPCLFIVPEKKSKRAGAESARINIEGKTE